MLKLNMVQESSTFVACPPLCIFWMDMEMKSDFHRRTDFHLVAIPQEHIAKCEQVVHLPWDGHLPWDFEE